MIAYVPAAWSGFGATVTEAAATLTGLLFVAVSINLRQIVAAPNLPGRAAITLITFVTALVAALLVVIPGQGRIALGGEYIAAGLVIASIQLVLDLRTGQSEYETALTRALGRDAWILLVEILR